MLENWLAPLPKSLNVALDTLENWQFGYNIAVHTEGGGIPDLKKTAVAIVGISATEADAVRHCLYETAWHFGDLAVTDLGNLRKAEANFLIPLLEELVNSGVVPLLLGGDNHYFWAQFRAYQHRKAPVSAVLIDERAADSGEENGGTNWKKVLNEAHLFHFALLAYQSHFINPAFLEALDDNNFEHLRLGRIKAQIEEGEPLVRDADMLAFNVAAMKKSDAPAQKKGASSGLTTEEACQLVRYAGISDKLTSFAVWGFESDLHTNQTVAQLSWYFLEGFYNRKDDYPSPAARNQLIQYVVDVKEYNTQIVFWKSQKSGRWWMEIPVKTSKKLERHRLIACSYNDYLQACRDELPERLFNAYKRFG